MAKNQDSNISQALLARKHILELLHELNLSETSPDEIKRIGDLIESIGEFFYKIIIDEMANLESDQLLKKYEYLIKYLNYIDFVPFLIDLLPKSKGNFKLRRTIINLLKYYNANFRAEPLNSYISEINSEISKIPQKIIYHLNLDVFSLHKVLEEFYYLDTNEKLFVLNKLAECYHSNQNVMRFFDILLRTGLNDAIVSSIEAIAKIRTGESLQLLEEALLYLPDEFHPLITKGIRKLSFMGIKTSEKQNKDSIIEKTYLGYPLRCRERYLLIVIRERENRHLCLVNIDLSDGVMEPVSAKFNLSIEMLERLQSNYEKEYHLKEVNIEYATKILSNNILYNYLYLQPFPPLFAVIAYFLPPTFIKPNSSYLSKGTPFAQFKKCYVSPEESEKVWEIIKDLHWLSCNLRFKEIVNKWYADSEKNSDFLDNLLIRKTIREIFISDLESWSKRFYLLADFLYNINEKKDIIPIISALEKSFSSSIEEMENMPFIRRFIKESRKIVLKGGD